MAKYALTLNKNSRKKLRRYNKILIKKEGFDSGLKLHIAIAKYLPE